MSPRGQRVQLAKPVLRSGALGLAPFNALSAAYLAAGHGDTILRFRDADARIPEGELSVELRMSSHTWQTLALKGHIFNGYADAFYRGRLPEVILAFPSMQALPDFWDDLTVYLEQLLSLGFFGNDSVSDLLPYFVLLGDGMRFSRIITALTQYLETMSHSYSVLDTRLRGQILGRFLRATPYSEPATLWSAEAWASLPVQRSLRINDVPTVTPCLQLAGGTLSAWERVRQCLNAYRIDVLVPEPMRTNAVERLELEQTWTRLSQVILPSLAQSQHWSDSETQDMLDRARQGLLAIGQHKNVFSGTEADQSTLPLSSKKVKKVKLSPQDPETRMLLEELEQTARDLPQSDARLVFADLIKSLSA